MSRYTGFESATPVHWGLRQNSIGSARLDATLTGAFEGGQRRTSSFLPTPTTPHSGAGLALHARSGLHSDLAEGHPTVDKVRQRWARTSPPKLHEAKRARRPAR